MSEHRKDHIDAVWETIATLDGSIFHLRKMGAYSLETACGKTVSKTVNLELSSFSYPYRVYCAPREVLNICPYCKIIFELGGGHG